MYLQNKNDRIKIINEIINGSSSRLREGFFKKNYIDIYNLIINYTLYIENITFIQRIWHWVNINPNEVLCKCNNKVSFNKNWLNGYKKYCSAKCSQSDILTKEKRKITTINKYGVDNISKLDSIKKKQAETNIKKYGNKSSFQNIDVQNKWKNNIKKKYGVDHIFQLKNIKDEIKKSLLNKYGVDNYTKTDDYKKKLIKKNLNDYGVDWYFKSDDFKLKSKKSNLNKYGNEIYKKTNDFKLKSKKTNLKNYGFEHPSKNLDIINKIKLSRLNNKKNKFDNKFNLKLIESTTVGRGNYFLKIFDNSCGHEFFINESTLKKRVKLNENICTVCNTIHKGNYSKAENEVGEFIKNLNINIEIKNKSIYKPYEIDIFVPSKNIAFEYNGLYWHSEFNKPKDYHLNKLEACKNIGVQLIHIWEDDWLYKKDIVKSMICNQLGLIKNKIYARKCIIKIVNTKDKSNFLDKNHIQGKSNSSINLGLYYNDELVSLMTFGWRNINSKKEFELIRFCSLLNTSVIGGASKLFKYFINNYDFDIISSYSDVSHFNGGIYKLLGFKYSHRSLPNYYWVVDGIRMHRFNFNKKKLIKMGFDPNKTENEIMHGLDHFRVFGCGQEKWIYKV